MKRERKNIGEETSISEHRTRLRNAITTKYKTNVKKFCEAHGSKIGAGVYSIPLLRNMLADNDKNVSINVLNDMSKYLKIPTLTRKTKIVKTNLYFVKEKE